MTQHLDAFDCFAVVAPGLEALALAEAEALGLPASVEEGGGGLAWRGDLRSILLANVGLRIASRVLVRVASFEAKSFVELEKQARRIPWQRMVAPGHRGALPGDLPQVAPLPLGRRGPAAGECAAPRRTGRDDREGEGRR